MNYTLKLVLTFLVAAAAAAPTQPVAKPFKVYGTVIHPGSVSEDLVLPSEKKGWPGLYKKPCIMVIQQDNKQELVAYLLEKGLIGLSKSLETQPLLEILRSGKDKIGVMLSAIKYLKAPVFTMPVTKVILPPDYTLATAAKVQAQLDGHLPWFIVTTKDELKSDEAGLKKLILYGDFKIAENSIEVASDVPLPVKLPDVNLNLNIPAPPPFPLPLPPPPPPPPLRTAEPPPAPANEEDPANPAPPPGAQKAAAEPPPEPPAPAEGAPSNEGELKHRRPLTSIVTEALKPVLSGFVQAAVAEAAKDKKPH